MTSEEYEPDPKKIRKTSTGKRGSKYMAYLRSLKVEYFFIPDIGLLSQPRQYPDWTYFCNVPNFSPGFKHLPQETHSDKLPSSDVESHGLTHLVDYLKHQYVDLMIPF
jgi:hypothetical protein